MKTEDNVQRNDSMEQHPVPGFSSTTDNIKYKDDILKREKKTILEEYSLSASSLEAKECNLIEDHRLPLTASRKSSKKYECVYCNFSTTVRIELKKHLIKKHKNKTLSSETLSLPENGKEIYKSDQCQYSTRRYGNLKRKVFCLHCEFAARDAKVLKYHVMAKHTYEKPFTCPHCNYESTHENNLKIHINSRHLNIKRFKCSHCSFETAHLGTMKKHEMSVHLNVKPYSCHLCNYRSVESRNVKRHIMALHTNERPFTCPLCPYSAVQMDPLQLHMKNKHTFDNKRRKLAGKGFEIWY